MGDLNQDLLTLKNDIENNNCCGIFLSQYSGITNKKNYQRCYTPLYTVFKK